MCILTLTEQGSKVLKVSRRIIIEKDKSKVLEIPVNKITTVICFGNVQVTNQALSLLFNNKIIVSMLSFDGKLKGLLLPPNSVNADLKYRQYNLINGGKTDEFCKSFINGKMNSILNLFDKRRNDVAKSANYIKTNINKITENLSAAKSFESILGIEGNISKEYYKTFGDLFHGDLKFVKRSKHPPKNEINSILSFGYVILNNFITSLLHSSGLDPYLGFFHRERYNRYSLSCDFSELFRALFVDRLVLKLINKKMIGAEDFERSEDDKIIIKKDALGVFFKEWKKILHEEKGLIDRLNLAIGELINAIRNNKIPDFVKVFQ